MENGRLGLFPLCGAMAAWSGSTRKGAVLLRAAPGIIITGGETPGWVQMFPIASPAGRQLQAPGGPDNA